MAVLLRYTKMVGVAGFEPAILLRPRQALWPS